MGKSRAKKSSGHVWGGVTRAYIFGSFWGEITEGLAVEQ